MMNIFRTDKNGPAGEFCLTDFITICRVFFMKPSFSFTCMKCGNCCCEEGFVFFSSEEIDNAADLLGLSGKEFIGKYLIKTGKTYAHEVMKGDCCVFLKNNKCIIQPVKPVQCRTFPFWNEYIGKKGELVNFDRPCRGIFTKKKEK